MSHTGLKMTSLWSKHVAMKCILIKETINSYVDGNCNTGPMFVGKVM